MVFGGLVQEFIDSNFLARETSELGRVNAQLKGAVNLNRATLAELQKEIEGHHGAIAAATDHRRQLTAELESLGSDKAMLWREVGTLRDLKGKADADYRTTAAAVAEAESRLTGHRAELKRLAAEGHTALAAEHRAKAEALAAEHQATVAALEVELSDRRADLARMATETADKAQGISGLNQELDRLKTALTQAETRFSEKHAALLQAYETALAQHRAKVEALEVTAIERGKALDAEIQNRQNRIAELEAQFGELKAQIIEEGEQVLAIARREFEVEQESAFNRIESERLAAHREITQGQEALVAKFRPAIEEPLLEEIQALQIEVGRLQRKQAAKDGKPFEWSPEQIKDLLVRELEDGSLRPNHLRIAGESESGKSHLVNQLISEGLKAFGLNCDFELFDPFASDTRWAIAPTIADDSEAVLARLNHWREFCEAESTVKRDRPMVIICDESDEMVRQYKDEMVNCIKAIWKRGRHVNVILWLLGQNGNVSQLRPLDWSDLKNAGSVYLNQVGFDYLKNGLKGRNTAALLGELEAIAEKHSYYALVHLKGKPRPYAVAIPKQLFPAATDAAETTTTPGATAAPSPACPKCGSARIKKAGSLNGRQRVKCNDCNKQSYAEGA